MRGIAKAIAFSALAASAVCLELNGDKADGLWIVVVLWALFGEFK